MKKGEILEGTVERDCSVRGRKLCSEKRVVRAAGFF